MTRQHQHQAGVDIVLKVGDHHLDIPRFIEHLGDLGALRPLDLCFLDNLADLVADGDDILSGTFFHRQIDGILAIQPGNTGFFLEAVNDLGNILQVDRFALVGADNQAIDLFRGLEFTRHPQLETAVAKTNGTARGVQILTLYGILQTA